MADQDLYGSGYERPMRIVAGRLALTTGVERLWEAVEDVLRTPRGTAPMDPTYGVPLVAYDPIAQAEQVAWAIGNAIEASVAQVEDVRMVIMAQEPGALYLQVNITPRDRSTESTRIYPWYRADEA